MPKRRNQNGHNQQMNYQNQSVMDDEELIARLSAIGGVISTIGGIMSTAASFLALQKFDRDIILQGTDEENVNPSDNRRISELERQIHYLTKEINELKGRRT